MKHILKCFMKPKIKKALVKCGSFIIGTFLTICDSFMYLYNKRGHSQVLKVEKGSVIVVSL